MSYYDENEYVITREDLKQLIRENDIPMKQLFTEKEILNDPVVKTLAKEAREKAIKEKKEREKKELDDMIPGLDNEPDNGNGNDDDSMIPD